MTKNENKSMVQFIAPKHDKTLAGQTGPVTLNLFQGLLPSRYDDNRETSPTGQTNIDRSQSTRQTGSHNSPARWFALTNKFGMTKRCAFTLAEVLITLGIIGVVAAITLPAFMENMNTQVKIKRIENIKQKLSKVTDKMAALDVLRGNGSTEGFITEMKKHMNIAKICKTNDIASCWPTKTVTLKDGKPWDISKTTTPKTLKIVENELFNEDWDNPMAIVTGDGTSMIISYNKNCRYDTNFQNLKYDEKTGKSASLSARCLAIVYDWNGGSRPNKLGDDVNVLDAAVGLGSSCAYQLGDLCIAGEAHEPTPLSYDECMAQKDALGIKKCELDNDYWAGAVAECGGTDKMLNKGDLVKMDNYVYDGANFYSNNVYSGIIYDSNITKRASELGLPDPYSYYPVVWSGEEIDSRNAYRNNFDTSDPDWHWSDLNRDYSGLLVLCKGD